MAADSSDGHIYVDFSRTDNAVEDLHLHTQQIDRILSQLETELKQLIDSWEGEDQVVYAEKQAKWHEAVGQMKEILRSHADLLKEIGEGYQTNQRHLTSKWEGVRIGR